MRSLMNKRWWWLPVIIFLILINFIAAKFHKRLDLTNEKRFTISSPAKKILNKLDDVVQVEIFLKGDLPAGFKKLGTSAEELLQEFNESAKGNIHYRLLSADESMEGIDRTYADTLSSMGLQPINLKVQLKSGEQSQYVYPAALVHYKDKTLPVSLYPGTKIVITPDELNSAEALMEYKFADAIDKLTQTNRPMVGYSTGNGEPTGANTYDLVENVLKKNYDLFTVNINTQPVISDTFKLLMIVKPSVPFTENEKLKIDQYIMRGGKVVWFIDRLNAEMDSLRLKNQVIAFDRNLNLEDILFKYGVRINPDLIMDLESERLPFLVSNNNQLECLKWSYFPLFISKNNHLINKNLGLVEGKFVNSIDTIKAQNITKTILLSSSKNARTISSPALISGEDNRNTIEAALFNKKDIAVGVLLEGKFKSLYANRIPIAIMDSMAGYGTPFQSESIVDNKIIVIADGDIVLNSTWQGKPLSMGLSPFPDDENAPQCSQPIVANKNFLENCLEYMINNSGLSEAKSKDYTLRLLDSKKITDEKTKWQILNLALPIFLVFIFGAIYQWLRKRKYSR